MTHRDTLNPPVPPDDCRGDDLTRAGIAAAVQYLNSPEPKPRRFPWPFALAVLAIVAVLVAVCALSWDAIAAGVAFLGLAPAAGSSLVAEAGRAMGDEVVR